MVDIVQGAEYYYSGRKSDIKDIKENDKSTNEKIYLGKFIKFNDVLWANYDWAVKGQAVFEFGNIYFINYDKIKLFL